MAEQLNKLEQLKKMTIVVSDTGDIDAIKKYRPQDATTNPSLILAALKKPEYHYLIEDAIRESKKKSIDFKKNPSYLIDKIFVNIGAEILKIIPGRVSTELDSRLSYDVEGSIEKAQAIIAMYEEMGISRTRILIKMASTWEGGLAARELEKMGIHCNMTLLFSLAQAIHCAECQATLISPFVGRILDWYKNHDKVDSYPPAEDPGVKSVQHIYNYYKKFGYKTVVMGASFRNKEEIMELAGCDLLTIAPQYFDELAKETGELVRKLDASKSKEMNIEKISIDEKTFRLMLNDDAMATEKLAEGIRGFAKASIELEEQIKTFVAKTV